MLHRARILRAEDLVSKALKERAERKRQLARSLPTHARRHATAVAAILLAGEPKVDEPLIRAWISALQHYGISVKDPTEKSEQISAAQHLFPLIVGQETSSAKFTEIFKSAPDWLLQFTRTTLDAWPLNFRLPHTEVKLKWGSVGFEDAERYPYLPLGVMTAGDPIPSLDERQIKIGLCSIGPTGRVVFNIEDLYAGEERLSQEITIVDDLSFALDLFEKEEWSTYEKRRMRKFLRWFSPKDKA